MDIHIHGKPTFSSVAGLTPQTTWPFDVFFLLKASFQTPLWEQTTLLQIHSYSLPIAGFEGLPCGQGKDMGKRRGVGE